MASDNTRAIEAVADEVDRRAWFVGEGTNLPLTTALVALLYADDPEPLPSAPYKTAHLAKARRTRQALRDEALRLIGGGYDE